ncbi:pantetheine-phosphate adenylyltransferase [Labilibaculum sp. A4]|uniref:Phosphopantetheine adenylyltransferase n=1 Tax=Labilibaculum euxinus TaxID=2686357 RepID=A0A425YCJ7_9BACT|nr:pantetheine-phosphate adenylyltransferase [Labilibaculum euxinus]MDQ1769777.1 pantetheine-phosphate adenylyltransferase [Labilibaculum euxinus]MUP36508.1 pantetheine-phosphate adenylyltransferase [Labilibaculum euxinus]MVB05713.1 pantetheine-phosphate adenylyltransferase [Labilibaculum euxinus]MWN76335.1 pantetheine-phosphate adenylyltransferase [Labilibaculum euxinus]
MERIAIFPGSFDPFTVGHESIVTRALPLFDKIIICIGYNSEKKQFFPIEKRIQWIKEAFANNPKIEVETFSGLTVEYCQSKNAKFILRGLRTAADFEYERAIAQINKKMVFELESIFLLTTPEHTPITSTIVRDIIRHGGNALQFLPKVKDPEAYKYKQ